MPHAYRHIFALEVDRELRLEVGVRDGAYELIELEVTVRVCVGLGERHLDDLLAVMYL